MGYEIPKNVNAFISKCAKEIGKQEADNFEGDVWCHCDNIIESPIEQILYCALETIRILNNFPVFNIQHKKDGSQYVIGYFIAAQCEMGKYIVDFYIQYGRTPHGSKQTRDVIIECDSQEWHERTEKERRYEKRRDRFLQLEGYKIFHFTGTEIIERPLEIAREIISYVTNTDIEDLYIDSNVVED